MDVQVEAADCRVWFAAIGSVTVHVAAQVVVKLREAVGREAVTGREWLRLSRLLLVVTLLLLQPVLLDLGVQTVSLLLRHTTELHR